MGALHGGSTGSPRGLRWDVGVGAVRSSSGVKRGCHASAGTGEEVGAYVGRVARGAMQPRTRAFL